MYTKTVYLDVCSLCRPFDDKSFLRIRMESEAVQLILENVRMGITRMIVSPAHFKEIEATSSGVERWELLSLLENYGELAMVNMIETQNKADELYRTGFGIADAVHVAFAESSGADFITCDDRLLRRCLKSGLNIWCGDPLQYCLKEELR